MFDAVSVMFAAHYACATHETLQQLVRNVACHLHERGRFVGIDMDGDTVAAEVGPAGRDYTDWAHLSLDGERLAARIQSISAEPRDEWLLRWPVFLSACQAAGLTLLQTGMLDPGPRVPQPELKAFSKLHRFWVFERTRKEFFVR